MYYSVSLDGLHWHSLNGKKEFSKSIKAIPTFVKDTTEGTTLLVTPVIHHRISNIWVSDDLIIWEKFNTFTPDLKSTPDYSYALQRIGAPKLFFDESSRQYVLTWHTPHKESTKEDPEGYWASQRTLYVLSKDLKTFSDHPTRLFDWNMGTIDVFIRKIGNQYYAVLKDETYPTLYWVTGKTI